MKRKLSALSQQYATALKQHMESSPKSSSQSARELGRKAVVLRLETLDVAKIHEESLAGLKASGVSGITKDRARSFFTEVIIPIEKTHRVAVNTSNHLSALNKTLGRHGVDLATSRRFLKKGIAQRKSAERALAKSEDHSKKLLLESHRLQKHLQHLTHRILSSQEDKRKKISHNLQDEIAQTLLGINVRLLTLKREAGINAEGLRKEIAGTRRLVDASLKSINRFARKFSKSYDT